MQNLECTASTSTPMTIAEILAHADTCEFCSDLLDGKFAEAKAA